MSISPLSGQERLRATQAAAALRSNALNSLTATTAPARQPDAVSISDTAKSLSAARKAVGNTPDVREDRINALKAAIASGSYAVDSRTLAKNIATDLES